MSYRKRIGNRIRQLNDVWEQKGVRIYLKQWEDFRVQYRGKSKRSIAIVYLLKMELGELRFVLN